MTDGRTPEYVFKYFSEEDAMLALHARDMVSCLWEIDQKCRSLLKYGSPSEDLAVLCEEIRRFISEEVDLDRLYR